MPDSDSDSDGIELGDRGEATNPLRPRGDVPDDDDDDDDSHEEPKKKVMTKALTEVQSSRRRLAKEADGLGWPDYASVVGVAIITTSVVAFQVLCVSDQQCFWNGEDPAVLSRDAARSIIPAVGVAILVAASIVDASNAARHRRLYFKEDGITPVVALDLIAPALERLRRRIARAAVFAAIAALFFLISAVERSTRFRGLRRSARRIFQRCDANSSRDRWRRRNDCHYTDAVRIFYTTHANLAEKSRANLAHFIAVFAVFSGLLFLAALVLVLLVDGNLFSGLTSLAHDCLRLRPRLVRR